MAHTRYVQYMVFQPTISPQLEHFQRSCRFLLVLRITWEMWGMGPLGHTNMRWSTKEAKSVLCVTVSDVVLTMLTTKPQKLCREHFPYLLLFARNLCLRKANTLRHTDTHSHEMQPNEHSRAASHYTYLIHFLVLFLVIAHVQLQTHTRTRTRTHINMYILPGTQFIRRTHITSHIVTKSHRLSQTY